MVSCRVTIMPWPEMNLTEPTDKTKYRFNWTAPIERVIARRQGHVPRRQRAVQDHRRAGRAGRRWVRRSDEATTRRVRGGAAVRSPTRVRAAKCMPRSSSSKSRRTMPTRCTWAPTMVSFSVTRDGGKPRGRTSRRSVVGRRPRERDRDLAARCRPRSTSSFRKDRVGDQHAAHFQCRRITAPRSTASSTACATESPCVSCVKITDPEGAVVRRHGNGCCTCRTMAGAQWTGVPRSTSRWYR